MAVTNFTANVAYYNGSSWDSSAAAQGRYGSNLRVGVIYYPGMNLKGKTINSVRFRVVSTASGNPATDTKTAYFYRSAYQKINTAVSGVAHKTGNSIGSASGKFYNNTLYFNADFLKPYIANGENTFCIYVSESNQSGVNWSKNYLRWSSVIITVDYSDTATVITPDPVSDLTPVHMSMNYYNSVKPVISWKAGANAVKYIIERAVSNDVHVDNFNTIAETTSLTFQDTSLNQTYGQYVRYRVTSVSSTGNKSAAVKSGSFRRMLPNIAPTNVRAVLTDDTITLDWTSEIAEFSLFGVNYYNGVEWQNFGETSLNSIILSVDDINASGNIKFRVRLIQASVDSDDIITSHWRESNSISIGGRAFVKVNGQYKQGKLFAKINGSYRQSKKVYIKYGNEWSEAK